jgi:hypothetical protein
MWLSRPAQIRAAIESSDLGVNRRSDRGWRLGKEWKARLRKARQDRELMNALSVKYGDEVPTESQLLVEVFRREVRAERQAKIYDEDSAFEDEYRESIRPAQESVQEPAPVEEPKSVPKPPAPKATPTPPKNSK